MDQFYQLMQYRVDLDKPLYTTMLGNLFAAGNSNAHKFLIEMYRGQRKLDATGEVVAKIVFEGYDSEFLDSGQIENGDAVFVMPRHFYSLAGLFSLSIIVKNGDDEVTVFDARGTMSNRSAGNLIDPDDVLPNETALLSAARDAQIAAQAATEAAESVDQKVADANAELTERVELLSNDVGELSESLGFEPSYTSPNVFNTNDPDIIEGGYITEDGTVANNSGYFETGYIPCEKQDVFRFMYDGQLLQGTGIVTAFYDAAKSFMASGKRSYSGLLIGNTASFFRVLVRSQYRDKLVVTKNDETIYTFIPYGMIPAKNDTVERLNALEEAIGKKKRYIDRNVNFVGMSIWWYDGQELAADGFGGGVTAKGYQSWLKEQFEFANATDYCYSGVSLGALSTDDTMSIMASKSASWAGASGDIWTLDTITNDFKRNIPVGEPSDYHNATGVMTYYGALRAFADKVQELSGNSAVVVCSNALKRNNSGYTSISENTVGATLLSYERALMYVCALNGWFFVDQHRLTGITDDTLSLTTLDGLHLNNLGYQIAVKPWIEQFGILYATLRDADSQ